MTLLKAISGSVDSVIMCWAVPVIRTIQTFQGGSEGRDCGQESLNNTKIGMMCCSQKEKAHFCTALYFLSWAPSNPRRSLGCSSVALCLVVLLFRTVPLVGCYQARHTHPSSVVSLVHPATAPSLEIN